MGPTYHTGGATKGAKRGEREATTLKQAIGENRADAIFASTAVLKKIAKQIAPLLSGFCQLVRLFWQKGNVSRRT